MSAQPHESVSPPVFLRRDGLLPAAELLTLGATPGLARTTTVFGQDAWLVTGAADIRAVLGDPALFTTGDSLPSAGGDEHDAMEVIGALLFSDPPEHTALRRRLAPWFTARAMARRATRFTEIVGQHIDDLVAAGPPADVVEYVARPIPAAVICELLGVPVEQRTEVGRLTEAAFDFTIPEAERYAATNGLRAILDDHVLRVRAAPGDDLFAELVADDDGALTSAQLVGIGATLLQAGHETTAAMISSGLLALLTHPHQLALLREQPALIGNAVEELLRYLAVVQVSPPRRAVRDTVIAGQPIARGDLVLVSLPAGNHDTTVVDDGSVALDITRSGAGHHLGFGHGIHHCLGAPLARLELTIALPMLLERLPRLALAEDPSRLEFGGTVVHALQRLPVTW